MRTGGADRRWWIFATVGVGTFMSALDGSAVNTALPVIRSGFGADVAGIEWVITIYLLVVSALLLTSGRLGDLHGQRPVYLAGFAIFVGCSALCGLSTSTALLVVGRALQGLGAAMIFSSGPAVLTGAFPAEERGRALGLLSTMTYLGLTAGPSIGGWLTQSLSWRAVFFLNVPFGLTALVLAFRFVHPERSAERNVRFDLPGAALFACGLTLLLLALNLAHDWGWGSARTIGLLCASAALLAGFLARERRAPAPMLDLDLFRNRVFSAATVSAGLNYIALFTATFIMPFYLIQGRGLPPGRAGTILTVQPLVMALTAPLSGILSDRIGSRFPATAGMGILAAGMFLLSRMGPDAPLLQVMLGLAVVGLGTGIFISPNSSALLGSAPRHRQGIASGVMATARNVGMVLGVGLSGAILATWMGRGAPLPVAVRAGFVAGAIVAALGVPVSLARGNAAPVSRRGAPV